MPADANTAQAISGAQSPREVIRPRPAQVDLARGGPWSLPAAQLGFAWWAQRLDAALIFGLAGLAVDFSHIAWLGGDVVGNRDSSRGKGSFGQV